MKDKHIYCILMSRKSREQLKEVAENTNRGIGATLEVLIAEAWKKIQK